MCGCYLKLLRIVVQREGVVKEAATWQQMEKCYHWEHKALLPGGLFEWEGVSAVAGSGLAN
jgi:hypothetical protein